MVIFDGVNVEDTRAVGMADSQMNVSMCVGWHGTFMDVSTFGIMEATMDAPVFGRRMAPLLGALISCMMQCRTYVPSFQLTTLATSAQ